MSEQNPFEYNGGACLAMCGKNCVAIASDLRYGQQFQTIATSFAKYFRITKKSYLGLTGLTTDVQTFAAKIQEHANLYKLDEEREMSPEVLSHFVAAFQYEKRFSPYIINPVIAGLNDKNEPFVSSMDSIGATTKPGNFVVAGTAAEYLYGVCESFWKPDMEASELAECAASVFLAGIGRDAYSGWGAQITIICPDVIVTRELKCRQD